MKDQRAQKSSEVFMSLSPVTLMMMARFHGFRPAGHGGFGMVLLLAGVAFAGLLVWVIARSGRPTIYR